MLVWSRRATADPQGFLEQREGHAACVLSDYRGGEGVRDFLVVVGGYSANADSSDIVAVPLAEDTECEVSVVGSSEVTARDGAVMHSLPSSDSIASVAIGFGGIDLDSYDQCNSCFFVTPSSSPSVDGGLRVVALTADIAGDLPPPRCRPASCMIVSDGCPRDFLQVPAANAAGQTVVTVPTNWALCVFGGEGADGGVLDDLWVLRAREASGGLAAITGELYWVQIRGHASPAPRYLAAMPRMVTRASGSDTLAILMYGGAHYGSDTQVISNNEVWEIVLNCTDAFFSGDGAELSALWRRIDLPDLPRCNGHVGAMVERCGAPATLFFGGKDFSTGSDDIHLISKDSSRGSMDSYTYECLRCPFADNVAMYVNEDEDVGGTGKGVWPHWRYTPALEAVMPKSGGRYLLLVGGDCRHNDVGSPLYQLRLD